MVELADQLVDSMGHTPYGGDTKTKSNNPITGIESYLSKTNGKFKHLFKRNDSHSNYNSRIREIVKTYLDEELNEYRSSLGNKKYYNACSLIQEDFKRFKNWVNEQNNRDFNW